MKQGDLFIIFSLGTGGTQRMMVNVINNIHHKNRKKILFLYNAIKTSDLESHVDDNVKIYKVSSTSKSKHLTRLKQLISIIKEENIYSIVSFALNGSYLALISKIFFPFRKIPIIYRLVSIDSTLTYSRYSITSKLKSFIFINVLCRFAKTIICQTDFMYNSLVKKSPKLLKKKTITIKNMIDISRIDNNLEENIQINYEYFIFIGRLSPEKNVKGIIEAFNIIKDQTNHKLLIIGNGSEYNNIRSLIGSLNLENRVLMLGFKSNPYKYLTKSSGLILFSTYEGLPNVVLESMYCKVPVIISNFDGAKEIVKHNETGFIVEKNDVAVLSLYMKQLINQNNSKVIENAHKYILNLNNDSISKYKDLII